MNTFDDDNEGALFDEPRRRPPRERRPQRSGPRRSGSPAGSNSVLRLAGLVALAIAILFGFALWVGSCGSKANEDYSSYIDAMRPLAQDSASVGKQFGKAIGTRALTMESLQSQLTEWSRQEQMYYAQAQRLQPPGPLQSAHAEALAAFQLRAIGLAGIASTLTLAQQSKDSPAAAGAALAGEARLLSSSDTVWEQLYKLAATQVLTDQNVKGVIVPASVIVTNSDIVSAHELAIVYQRVSSPSSGGKVTGNHGSALISTSAVESGVPKLLSTAGGTTVFASQSSLVITVVLEDSGDYPEVQIPVTLTVKSGTDTVYTATETVSQIAAHAQTTVSFAHLNLPPNTFSHNGFISVKIHKVDGENDVSNNVATYPVFFRLATR